MILYARDYILFGLLLTVIILALLRLQITLSLSTEGDVISSLQDEIHYYHLQNMELKDQYLQAASYHTIAQKAWVMGLREEVKTWTITQTQ